MKTVLERRKVLLRDDTETYINPVRERLSASEAFFRAKKEDMLWVPNGKIDKMLVASNGKVNENALDVLPGPGIIRTGTLVVYPELGRALEKFMEYSDPFTREIWRIRVQDSMQKTSDKALFVDFPFFDLIEEKDGVYTINLLDLTKVVSHIIPEKSREEVIDERTCVPIKITTGNGLFVSEKQKRFLLRAKGPTITFIHRDFISAYACIDISEPPSSERKFLLMEK